MNYDWEEDMAELLGQVWRRVRWRRMVSRTRPATDIFQHRLKVAALRSTIREFVTKLCHGLNLQSVQVEPALINRLEEKSDEILSAVFRENVYWTLVAQERAKEVKRR